MRPIIGIGVTRMQPSQEMNKIRLAIKVCLRNRGHTYQDLAAAVGVSEATVKRWMSSGDLSVLTLAEVCQWLGITLCELLEFQEPDEGRLYSCTWEQEVYLAKNPRCFRIFKAILCREKMDDSCKRMNLKTNEYALCKEALKMQGLVDSSEHLSRILVREPIVWIENGPLRKAYDASRLDVSLRFFRENFPSKGNIKSASDDRISTFRLSNICLSHTNAEKFAMELDEIFLRYEKQGKTDVRFAPHDKLCIISYISMLAPFDHLEVVLSEK